MTRPILVLGLVLVATLAGCKIGGGEELTAGASVCAEVGTACAGDAECCSYGCMAGVCAPNPLEGGACRTTNDCDGVRLCKGGACLTPMTAAAACRDTGDVCSWYSQCCSGNCEASRCTTNRAPIADAGADVPNAPYTKLFTLANASVDPDDDPLIYGWSFLSKPAASLATLSSGSVRSPWFTPDVVGTYVLKLVVTDGPAGAPNRLTAEDTVTIVAVNRAPVPVVAAPPATWSRNVEIEFSASVSDPDGDAIQCAWVIAEPGATPALESAAYGPCANPSSATHTYTPKLEGTYSVHYLARNFDATSGAGFNVAVASVTFVSVNDAPVATVPTPRAGNLGAGGAPGAPIPVAATASDVNGDTAFTWKWTFDQVPPSSGLTDANLVGADQASVSFAPDAIGSGATDQYVLRVRVCDAGLACSEKTVPVNVYRHIQPLVPGPIDDAEWANGKIFLVGPDPDVAGSGKLWILSAGAIEKSVALGTRSATVAPQLGVDRTGKLVVVADVNVRWLDATAASPTVQSKAAPFAVGDVAVPGTQYAALFPTTSTTPFQVLDTLATGGQLYGFTPSQYGQFAAASPTTDGDMFVNDRFNYRLRRYSLVKQGSTPELTVSATSTSFYSCTERLWAAATGSHVFDTCAGVNAAATLAPVTTLSGATPPLRHVHSSGNATSAGAPIALGSSGTTLLRYDASFNPLTAGNEAIPVWGFDGVPQETLGKFAFTSADGATRWVIVQANGRTGLVTFP